MTEKTYTQTEVDAMMAEVDKEMSEELAKERARADAAEEALRIATQAANYNATISQKRRAFAACIPYSKLRCRQQHLVAANMFERP